MSVHIVDDEQRSDRPATPMRPSGFGQVGHLLRWRSSTMHRLRRAALHLPPPSQERGPS